MTKEEKIKESKRKWREANREKLANDSKAWRQANKDYAKAYYKKNKEKMKASSKDFRESKKDGLYTVYYLVNENYVGQTNNLYQRLSVHKNDNSRDVSIVKIIGKYKTREEAIEVEASYHSIGFNGRHINAKKQTI